MSIIIIIFFCAGMARKKEVEGKLFHSIWRPSGLKYISDIWTCKYILIDNDGITLDVFHFCAQIIQP